MTLPGLTLTVFCLWTGLGIIIGTVFDRLPPRGARTQRDHWKDVILYLGLLPITLTLSTLTLAIHTARGDDA